MPEDQLYGISELDLSRKILGNIFGQISFLKLGDYKTSISELMRIFNLGVLIFAGGYASYSVGTTVINYAKQGGPMDAQTHSPWAPVRAFIGTSLLVPTVSGYSMIQVIVIWAVLQGIGLADTIWQKMVDQLKEYGVVVSENIDNSKDVYNKVFDVGGPFSDTLQKGSASGLSQIMASAVCSQTFAMDTRPIIWQNCRDDFNAVCIGYQLDLSQYGRISDYPEDKCGRYSFNECNNDTNCQIRQATAKSLLQSFYLDASNLDYKKPEDNIANYSTLFLQYGLMMQQALKPYIKKPVPKDNSNSSWSDEESEVAKKQGWVAAGLNYFKFSSRKMDDFTVYDVGKVKLSFPNLQSAFVPFKSSTGGLVATINDARTIAMSSYQSQSNSGNQNIIAEKDLDKAMDFVAIAASDYFNGLDSITPNSTTFSENSNTDSGWLSALTLGLSKTYKPTGINLQLVRDHTLVLNAKIAQALLGLNLIADASWYEPGVKPENQAKIFTKYCAKGLSVNKDCLARDMGLIYSLKKYQEGERIDPMSAISRLGAKIMWTSLGFFQQVAIGVYKVMKMLATKYAIIGATLKIEFSAIAEGLSFLGAGDFIKKITDTFSGMVMTLFSIDQKSMMAFLPFSGSMAVIYFLAGAMLAIYIPFVPFIVFFFTVIGWVITVVEAMVAAPLIALGVTHPQGHDLLGKSEQAMILLLGVFVRPAAIVIGFVFSIYLLYVAFVLLNMGFLVAISGYLSGTAVVTGIINKGLLFMSLILMYVYVLSSIVHQVFGLTYKVPEQLMRWIGMAPEVSGTSQMLGEVKQGVQSGLGQAGEGGKQSASQAPRYQPSTPKSYGRFGDKLADGARSAKDKIKSKLSAKSSDDQDDGTVNMQNPEHKAPDAPGPDETPGPEAPGPGGEEEKKDD